MSEDKFTTESTVCAVCGLPRELCVCSTISRETQQVVIKATKRRYGKLMTVVQGIDPKDISSIAKQLKSKLACGGTIKENEIELQGDHRQRVKQLLMENGFPAESITVITSIR